MQEDSSNPLEQSAIPLHTYEMEDEQFAQTFSSLRKDKWKEKTIRVPPPPARVQRRNQTITVFSACENHCFYSLFLFLFCSVFSCEIVPAKVRHPLCLSDIALLCNLCLQILGPHFAHVNADSSMGPVRDRAPAGKLVGATMVRAVGLIRVV